MILISLMWYSLLLGGFVHCNAINEISAKENSISHQNKIENIVENPSVINNEKVEVIINYDNCRTEIKQVIN